MIWPRLIPILTVLSDSVYKTTQFQNPIYVGDPLNSVSLFSQLKAQELIVLDISEAHGKSTVSKDLVSRIIDHANLPIGFGGGLRDLDQVKYIFDCGYDKVILRTLATNFIVLEKIAGKFGSQALTICLDILYNPEGNEWTLAGMPEISNRQVIDFALKLEEVGVGEIIIQDVYRDGTLAGFRKSPLIASLVAETKVPIVVSGGGKSLSDSASFIRETGVHSIAGSRMFLYKQPKNALLLNYPSIESWIAELGENS